tara:strand:- start:3835 stop:3987 length:153 start_codon:yes stop_codon:yes gene_type:complete
VNFDDLKVLAVSAAGVGNWAINIDLGLKIVLTGLSIVYVLLKIKQLLKKE